jgi:hypothetical protein
MRWLTERAMQRRRATISAEWKKKREDCIDATLRSNRVASAGWRVKV